eukprot:57878_1
MMNGGTSISDGNRLVPRRRSKAYGFIYRDETFLTRPRAKSKGNLDKLTEAQEYVKTPITFNDDDDLNSSNSSGTLNESESSLDSDSTLNATESSSDNNFNAADSDHYQDEQTLEPIVTKTQYSIQIDTVDDHKQAQTLEPIQTHKEPYDPQYSIQINTVDHDDLQQASLTLEPILTTTEPNDTQHLVQIDAVDDRQFEYEQDEYQDEYDMEYEDEYDMENEDEYEDSFESSHEDALDFIDEELGALMAMHNECSTPLVDADEGHNDNLKLIIHRPVPTIGMQYTPKDFIDRDKDADAQPLNGTKHRYKIWKKLRKIPASVADDRTETRIVREFTLFTYNHDGSIADENIEIHNMEYPNIFKWNGLFIGPRSTPYYNGKYKICMVFKRSYPETPPTLFILTKIYNSSVKWNKQKGRGLVCLPKHYEKIWNANISVREWVNCVYEFIFYYGGDHYYDPINKKMANQFKYAFDSFVDYCYEYNVLYANGFDEDKGMIEAKQKLTAYCIRYGNQWDVEQYNALKEEMWRILRDLYHIKYQMFIELMCYFGDEFYYCCLSELIRYPHVCVGHKIKQFSNIMQW